MFKISSMLRINRRVLGVLFFVWSTIPNTGTCQKAPPLGVGSPAPPLNDCRWVRGPGNLSEFDPDTIYLIEFGSIGCLPCRASIPHLTEVAKGGKIRVISIYIWENGFNPKDTINFSYATRVEKFIRNMGDQIGYEVAVDSPPQTLAKSWVLASGQNSIPVAFLVKENRIAWKGNPIETGFAMARHVYNEQTAGFEKNKTGDRNDENRQIDDAWQSGDYEIALTRTNQLIQSDSNNLFLYQKKFEILLDFDEEKAYQLGYELLNGICKDSEPILLRMAQNMVIKKNKLKTPEWDVSFQLVTRALELSKDDYISATILRLRAEINYFSQNYKGAVSDQEKALTLLENTNHERSLARIDEYKSQLVFYKKYIN